MKIHAPKMTVPSPPMQGRLALFARLLGVTALLLPGIRMQAGVTETTIYSFQATSQTDGAAPYAGLVQGKDGFFYGTTTAGGTSSYGTVFKINSNGMYTNLYSFTGTPDGAQPYGGLAQGSDGFLYGTTVNGGTNGYGMVFKISTNGACTSLHSFNFLSDGAAPYGALAQGSDGYLYGTTSAGGGTNGHGTVFKISIAGAFTNLYSFINTSNGANPYVGVIQGSDGYLYGIAYNGGASNCGTVFKASTNGELTGLHSFTVAHNSASPYGGLVQAGDGYLYGAMPSDGGYGTAFKISTNGAFTSLHSFISASNGYYPTGTNDGAFPEGGLVQGSNGYVFGATEYGGADDFGSVFILSTNGAYSPLYSFTEYSAGLEDGAGPQAGLTQGTDGNFYGTASAGGAGIAGTVYRLSFTVPAVPQITTMTLPNGTNGLSYSQQMFALYGQPPYSWSLVSGSFPVGLGLTTNGVISGAPTTNGTFNFIVRVTDALSATSTQALALAVGSAPGVVWIQPTNNPVMAIVGSTVTFSVSTSGTGPFNYQWQQNGTNLLIGVLAPIAGDEYGANIGSGAYSGDGGAGTNAELYDPCGVALDSAGNLFIADTYNQRIRKVDAYGIITTVAGGGTNGYIEGAYATNVQLNYPFDLTVDPTGNLLIADSGNNCIRKLATNGIITTVAGNGTNGFAGDGGPAINAELNHPDDVTIDAGGNLFIADSANNRIRKVATNGIVTTVAGNGTNAYSGDGRTATNAGLSLPANVAVDPSGNLFIGDSENGRVRKVGTNGIITTVAGGGTNGLGDGGAATNAELDSPSGVALDKVGDLFIADTFDGRIREVSTNGIITTIAGSGPSGLSDAGVATNAELYYPEGVTTDLSGNLYIADTGNDRILATYPELPVPTLALNGVNFGNAGGYDVVISSPYGSVTSSVVTLNITSAPVILSAPQITAGNTNFTFLFSGPPGSNYVLEVSTNLLNWSSAATSTIPVSGSILLTNEISGFTRRFYRAYVP